MLRNPNPRSERVNRYNFGSSLFRVRETSDPIFERGPRPGHDGRLVEDDSHRELDRRLGFALVTLRFCNLKLGNGARDAPAQIDKCRFMLAELRVLLDLGQRSAQNIYETGGQLCFSTAAVYLEGPVNYDAALARFAARSFPVPYRRLNTSLSR